MKKIRVFSSSWFRECALAALLACLTFTSAAAQQQPRPDRADLKTVRLRIDLRLNENAMLAGSGGPTALPQLIAGHYADGSYDGYDPWELAQLLTHDQFSAFMLRRDAAWPSDDLAPAPPCQCSSTPQQAEAIPIDAEAENFDYDFAPVFDVIEERWFDRTLGRERVKPRYIVLYYAAENGVFHPAIAFRFTDVETRTFGPCRWLSPMQEPAALSLKQIFELRRFRGVIIDESGREVRSFQEAEKLRARRVEAEHQRYEY